MCYTCSDATISRTPTLVLLLMLMLTLRYVQRRRHRRIGKGKKFIVLSWEIHRRQLISLKVLLLITSFVFIDRSV